MLPGRTDLGYPGARIWGTQAHGSGIEKFSLQRTEQIPRQGSWTALAESGGRVADSVHRIQISSGPIEGSREFSTRVLYESDVGCT